MSADTLGPHSPLEPDWQTHWRDAWVSSLSSVQPPSWEAVALHLSMMGRHVVPRQMRMSREAFLTTVEGSRWVAVGGVRVHLPAGVIMEGLSRVVRCNSVSHDSLIGRYAQIGCITEPSCIIKVGQNSSKWAEGGRIMLVTSLYSAMCCADRARYAVLCLAVHAVSPTSTGASWASLQ